MGLARALAAVLAASLVAAAASGQTASPTGSIHGTVLDEQKRPISGAAVSLAGPGVARTTTTDERGDFRLLRVAPGLHTLELAQPGFARVRLEVSVQPGKSVVLDVTMPVAGAAEAVTVTGDPSAPDSRKVETGATQDQRELAAIPTTRDPWGVLRQVPGVLVASMDSGGGAGAFPEGFVGKGTRMTRIRSTSTASASRSRGSRPFSSTSTPSTASACPPAGATRRARRPAFRSIS